jgi:amidase
LEKQWSRPERALSVGDFTAALEQWDEFRSRMLRFWRDYDVLICPVNATWAFPHGTREEHGGIVAYSHTMTHNLTGWPCAVVRCGTSPEGLPIGVQVVAPPWREDVALAVAGYLEGEFGGWRAVGA